MILSSATGLHSIFVEARAGLHSIFVEARTGLHSIFAPEYFTESAETYQLVISYQLAVAIIMLMFMNL